MPRCWWAGPASRIPIEESAAPIKDDRGETIGIVVVFRDVTEQRAAEEALRISEARMTGIIQSAMDAIITINSNHEIVVFNAAAEHMFRCNASGATGRQVDEFIPPRFREATIPVSPGIHQERQREGARRGARIVIGLRA